MAESQNSTSSSSDKDSLFSIEKNIPVTVSNCNIKGTHLASTDDEDGSDKLLITEEENHLDMHSVKLDEQELMKPVHHEHVSSTELRQQPKMIKNIMMALKEGKVRENSSPMRGNRTKAAGALSQRTNTEAMPKVPKPSVVAPGFKSHPEIHTVSPAKASSDSAKRILGSHPIKHQVELRYI